MPNRTVLGAAIVLALGAVGCASDSRDGDIAPLTVLGYSVGEAEAVAAIGKYAAYLTAVSADHFVLDAAGALHEGEGTEETLALCAEAGIAVYACVSNYSGNDFDGSVAHAAIVDRRDAVIDSLVALAASGPFAGINLDLEAIYPADREAFGLFVEALASRLSATEKRLIVSVPAASKDDPSDDWAGAYDYERLAAAADYLQLMTYDEHGPWGDSGPIAGMDWMKSCLEYAVSVAEPRRLLLGLPAYGYDWDLDAPEKSTSRSLAEIEELRVSTGAVKTRGGMTRSVTFSYAADGERHIVYYEDDVAVGEKAALALQYDLGGVAVWSLGQEDPGFWPAVRRGLGGR